MNKFFQLYRKFYKLPKMAAIEFCSNCQLNCVDCYMRNKTSGQTIGSGYLKFEDFKNFIENNPYIESIETSLSGEIFLNPDFLKIIEYAYKKNVKLTAFNGVNFNTVSDEILEALVKYNFTGLTISLDGTSQETYIKYRRNGNFDKIIQNIEKLNDFKRKYNSKFPILMWQFIFFEHCQNEYFTAYKMAEKLGFSLIYYKLPWKRTNLGVEDAALFKKARMLEIKVDDKEIQEIIFENSRSACSQLWWQPQINWNGKLLGCCCSTNNDLEVNVFETGLKKAIKSKQMKKMRDVLAGKILPDTGMACKKCCIYPQIRETKSFIKPSWFKF